MKSAERLLPVQTRLFAKEYPKRPGRHEEAITKRAVEMLLPEVRNWLGDEADERILTDLIDAAKYGNDEGYELARSLERRGYSPDAELVEILDSMTLCRYEAHKKAVAAWVRAHDLRLDLAIGSPVSLVVSGKNQVGEIRDLRPETAEYVVFIESLGHVRSGVGPQGVIVGFEGVAAVVTKKADHA